METYLDGMWVSILVFLDLALRDPALRPPFSSIRVSILVFLDLALRVGIVAEDSREFYGFNPCFLGSCSPSI